MTEQPSAVGVAGLGVMGSVIARRLLETGHRVSVFDIRPEAVRQLVADGAIEAGTPADLAATGTVVLSLNTAEIVEQVAFGAFGVLSGDYRGTLVIDMSSIDPGLTSVFAARAKRIGAAWVDAPLSGGAPAAEHGDLTLMLGGADEDVLRAIPVLECLSNRLVHLGLPGAGQLTKVVNQVLVGCGFAALAEAAAFVRSAGLDPDLVLATLSGGRADSAVLREFFTKFVTLDMSVTGRVANMVKDLDTARDYARARDMPLPVTTAVLELNRWLVATGHGDADNASLMHYYENRQG